MPIAFAGGFIPANQPTKVAVAPGSVWCLLGQLVMLRRKARSENTEDTFRIEGVFAPTVEDLRWEDAARAEIINELPNVRRTAAAWELRLTAVFTVFGAAAFIVGSNDIRSLESPWSLIVGMLVIAAIAVAAGALFLAALAAEGTPSAEWTSGRSFQARQRQLVRTARRNLVLSRVLAALFLLILSTAAAVSWLAPLDSRTSSEPAECLKLSSSGTARSVRVEVRECD